MHGEKSKVGDGKNLEVGDGENPKVGDGDGDGDGGSPRGWGIPRPRYSPTISSSKIV